MGNARSACKLAVVANSNMAYSAYLACKNAVIADCYAAADADMRHNEAVFAQYVVMSEMYKIINFGTGTYNRAACGSPVDTGIAADFNLVLQHNIACLQNKAVFAGLFIGNVAEAVAAEVGVDDVYAEVLPEDKAAFVRSEKAAGRKVIMIGDGVNDSPALSEADAGIAMSDGAAIAREIADVTICSDDLESLVTLKRISDGLMQRIHANYRFIISFNTGLIVLGVAGVLPPSTSALLHNISTLGIGLRSMRNLLP